MAAVFLGRGKPSPSPLGLCNAWMGSAIPLLSRPRPEPGVQPMFWSIRFPMLFSRIGGAFSPTNPVIGKDTRHSLVDPWDMFQRPKKNLCLTQLFLFMGSRDGVYLLECMWQKEGREKMAWDGKITLRIYGLNDRTCGEFCLLSFEKQHSPSLSQKQV